MTFLFFLLGIMVLLTTAIVLMAYNSTTVAPRPKVTKWNTNRKSFLPVSHNCCCNDGKYPTSPVAPTDFDIWNIALITHISIRNFSIAGPRVWNAVPSPLQQDIDYEQFKRQLKTFVSELDSHGS